MPVGFTCKEIQFSGIIYCKVAKSLYPSGLRGIGSDHHYGSDGKVSAHNVGDLGSIPGLGRSPGEGNGNPLQHSCLENPMDGGA